MSQEPRPQFKVERVNPRALRWRRVAQGAALVLAFGVGVFAGWNWGGTPAAPQALPLPAVAGSEREQALEQQVANLTQASQIAAVATRDLRQTLTEREEEISALRTDLAFYTRLVGSGERELGLSVQGVQLQPVPGSRAWDVTVTLTQRTSRGKESKGTVRLAVEGVADEQLQLLDWDALGSAGDPAGLPYAFRYFQQLHATILLPAGFIPNRLRVQVHPAGGRAVTRDIAWSDALTSAEESHVQEPQGG